MERIERDDSPSADVESIELGIAKEPTYRAG
jgi:hypothetical protein